MAGTPYLQAADYASFGIPDAQGFQVAQASRYVDNYLGRPEGLLWSADANGQPAWMTGLTPTRSFAPPQPIQPGSSVQVTIPHAQFGYQTIGEVAILDRGDPQLAEACVVSAASGNTITLDGVQFAHSALATMDFGLTIMEEVPVRAYKQQVRCSRAPLAQMMSAFGRYEYSRRDLELSRPSYAYGSFAEQPLPGVPLNWAEISLSNCDINYSAGAIWVLPVAQQPGFNAIRLRYVAGWQYATLPEAIKRATANLVRNAIDSSDLPGNVKMVKFGNGTMEKFRDSVLDSDTRSLLQPYRLVRI